MDTINAIAQLCTKAENAATMGLYADSMVYWMRAANLASKDHIQAGFTEKAMDMMMLIECPGAEGIEVEFPTVEEIDYSDTPLPDGYGDPCEGRR